MKETLAFLATPPQATGEGPDVIRVCMKCGNGRTCDDCVAWFRERGHSILLDEVTEFTEEHWRAFIAKAPTAKPPNTVDMLPGQWCTKHGDEMHTTHEYNPSVAARWALQHNFGRCAYVEEPIAKCPGCGKTVSLFTEASDYTGPPRYWCSKLNCKLLPKPVPLEEIPSQDPSG